MHRQLFKTGTYERKSIMSSTEQFTVLGSWGQIISVIEATNQAKGLGSLPFTPPSTNCKKKKRQSLFNEDSVE